MSDDASSDADVAVAESTTDPAAGAATDPAGGSTDGSTAAATSSRTGRTDASGLLVGALVAALAVSRIPREAAP